MHFLNNRAIRSEGTFSSVRDIIFCHRGICILSVKNLLTGRRRTWYASKAQKSHRHSGSYVPLGMTLLLKKFLTGSNLTYRISSREERPRDGEKGKTAQQLFQKRDD